MTFFLILLVNPDMMILKTFAVVQNIIIEIYTFYSIIQYYMHGLLKKEVGKLFGLPEPK